MSNTRIGDLTYEYVIEGTGWGHKPTYDDAEIAAEDFADLVARGRVNITLIRRQVGDWETVEESP